MQNYRRLIAVFMTTIMLISIFSTTLASAAEVENTDTQAQTDVVEVAVDDEITDTAANTDVTTTAAEKLLAQTADDFTDINLGYSYSFTWNYYNDEDIQSYRFYQPSNGYVTVKLNKLGYSTNYVFGIVNYNTGEMEFMTACVSTSKSEHTYEVGLSSGYHVFMFLPAFDITSTTTNYKSTFSISHTPNEYWEREYNGTTGTATAMTLGKTYTGVYAEDAKTDDASNDDYFSVHLTKGQKYKFTIECPSTLLQNYYFDVYNPSHSAISSLSEYSFRYYSATSGNSRSIEYTAETTGFHYLRFYGASNYVEGYKYTLNVSEVTVAPAIPNIKTPVVGANNIEVNWDAVAGADGYLVYRKIGDSDWEILSTVTSGTTLVDYDVYAGVKYTYCVRAYNSAGYSGFSSYVNASLISAPEMISAATASSGVKVTWDSANTTGGYYLYRKTASTDWTKIAIIEDCNTLSYTDKTAKNGTKYYYAAKAYLGTETSELSNSVSVTYLMNPKMGKVTSVSTGLKVAWTAQSGVSGYKVYRKTLPNGDYKLLKTVSGASKTSYTDTSVKTGVNYKYAIKTYKGSVLSAYSSTAAVSGVKISPTSKSLVKGASTTIKVSGINSKYSFKTSKSKVATVSSKGKVTSKANGTAYIYINAKGIQKSVKITVKSPSVSISASKTSIKRGYSTTFTAKTFPSKKVTWKSSNTKVATVSSSGKVTGKGKGTATITASFKYNGKTYKASKKITVTVQKPTFKTFMLTESSYSYYHGVIIKNTGSKTLRVYGSNAVLDGYSFVMCTQSGNRIVDLKYVDIKPGGEYIAMFRRTNGNKFYYIPGDYLTFYLLYDGVKYSATVSSYNNSVF